MNKREIIAYFDARAPEWDARMVRSDSKIAFILDAAGVRPGVSVLDVACGTGVLFGDYLARDAARVTGVDISPEMARIAVSKLRDPRVEVLCGDVEEAVFLSDRVLVVESTPIHTLTPVEVPAAYPRSRECLARPELAELKERLIAILRKQVTP